MIIALDIGNTNSLAFTETETGTRLVQCPSKIAPVATRVQFKRGTGQIFYNGKYAHVGENATKYMMYSAFATMNKASVIEDVAFMVYFLLSQFELEPTVNLVLQVPETNGDYEHILRKRLHGSHVWECDGKAFNVKFVVRDVFVEGFGSWYMGASRNELPTNGYTLVIDIGGGSTESTLIDNEPGSRMGTNEIIGTRSDSNGGTVELFRLIADDPGIRVSNGGITPKIEEISDAVSSGKYLIGRNGADIKSTFEAQRVSWWKSLYGRTLQHFYPYFQSHMVTRVLITGGGGEIVRPLIEAVQLKGGRGGMFSVSRYPLIDNVTGIYYAYTEQ